MLVFAARDGATAIDLDGGLRLIGLQAMVDPPRPGVEEAIAACHAAGVRVSMLTGDHPRTARAIGTAIGLADGPAVTGAELEQLDDDELGRADIYARVAPEHKLRLVQALQARGEVVAVTGDGVNDAPALRQADIGVAMGRGGTAAAKEAADMVLADDDFSTLRAAIEEGRRVYDNLVKALAFVLPTSVGQALIIAVAVLAFPAGGAPVLPVDAGPDPLDQPDRRRRARAAAGLRGARARPDAPPAARPRGAAARPPAARAHARRLDHADRGRARAVRARPRRRTSRSRARRPPRSPARCCCRRSTCSPAARSRAPTASSATGATRPSTPASPPCSALQALFVFAPFMQAVFGSAALGARELAWAGAPARRSSCR